VGFVNDQTGIGRQIGFGEYFSQQHTVRHVLDDSFGRSAIFELDGVAYLVAQADVHFRCDARRYAHGGDTSGLSATNLSQFAVSHLV